jgi:hypothetical protein
MKYPSLLVDPMLKPAFTYESGNRVKHDPSGENQMARFCATLALALLQGKMTGVAAARSSPSGQTPPRRYRPAVD